MKTNWRKSGTITSAFLVFTTITVAQQFTNVGGGWWRTNFAAPNIGRGVAIGNLTTTPYPAAFQVHGELMPTGNNTGEVFRTNAPLANSTYWRMYRGSVAAGAEYGTLYNLTGETNFNVNAPNGALRFHTNTLLRMAMNPTITYPTLGPSFSLIPADGFVGICPTNALWTAPSPGPWARLHLHDPNFGGILFDGYRDWMINGTLITGHGDQMFVGHKYGTPTAPSDAIISWSDNNVALSGPDHMRFVFTDNFTGAATGEHSSEGLEIMRLHPQGMVGIGDFFAGVDEPTERLDVRTGRVRIRQLPVDPVSVSTEFVTVNTTPGPLYGLLEHRAITSLPDNCEWSMSTSAPNHVWTASAIPADPNCPDATECVGIGTATMNGKLSVDNDPTLTVKHTAVLVRNNFPVQTAFTGTQAGIDVTNVGGGGSTGGYFKAYGSGTDASGGPTGT